MTKFFDRTEAGQILGDAVTRRFKNGDLLILALPRGGIPVGYAVSRITGAPLEVLTVRKLGVPGRTELAFGAIAPDKIRVLDLETISAFRLSPDVIAAVECQERDELNRREKAFRGPLRAPDVGGKTVIIVDDGLATGATMEAALAWVKRHGAKRAFAAAPVASHSARERLLQSPDCDGCIFTLVPDQFYAVGNWYENFPQLSDAMVTGILHKAWGEEDGKLAI